jgi:hypothetical protein
MLIKIDSLCIEFEKFTQRNNFAKLLIQNFAKIHEMYWYLKNLHNEIISRNNLYEISLHFAKFRERKYNEIKITFVVISYFAK